MEDEAMLAYLRSMLRLSAACRGCVLYYEALVSMGLATATGGKLPLS